MKLRRAAGFALQKTQNNMKMKNYNAVKIVKRVIDLAMILLSVLLMGGITAFRNVAVHEWLGTALTVLWIFHNILNRNFYKSIFRGKYNGFRIIMVSVNLALIACAFLLAASGIILSNSVFAFLGIENGMAFARTTHLVASHWYYILIAFHFSLHAGVIFSCIPVLKNGSMVGKILRKLPLIISVYGIYAFAIRGFYKYLFYLQPFFFFDVERGVALFILDYFSIFVLVATVFYYIGNILKYFSKKSI